MIDVSFAVVEKATDDLDPKNLLGRGAFAEVFLGHLSKVLRAQISDSGT
jgi:hypothetical protein